MIRRQRLLVATAWVTALWPAMIHAGGFDTEDFTLRFPAARSRFSQNADVAGRGGASAASKWPSSINPASSAWVEVAGTARGGLSLQYAPVTFEQGPTLNVFIETLLIDSRGAGVFEPALAQVRSDPASTRQGIEFEFDADLLQLRWGKYLTDRVAVGAAVTYTRSKSRTRADGQDLALSRSDAYAGRAGTLFTLVEHLWGGLVVEYGAAPARTTLLDVSGLGVGDRQSRDTTWQLLLRPGLAYEYKKDTFVLFDYQLGHFANDTGHLLVHRFFIGAEYSLLEWFYVRGGAVFDTRGNAAWATGLGIYPGPRVGIDLAYQRDMFPEVAVDFGRAQVLTVSVAVGF